MTKKQIKNIFIYIISAAISVLFISYIFYHLFSSSDNDVETSPAMLVTKSNTVSLEAYIVRDETVLSSSVPGGVNYLFSDGDRVGSGTVIANIFSGEGAEQLSDRILALDKEITILENSSVDENATRTDSKVIDSKINEIFYLIRDGLERGDTEYAIYRKDEFLTYLNKRQVLTQNVSGFEDQIVSLIREKETLSGQLVNLEEHITTETAGYFYSEVDGYENIFRVSDLNEMTLNTYADLVDSEPEDFSSSLAIGKLVNSNEWYILSEISSNELKGFSEGASVQIRFPYNADAVVKATVYRVIRENDADKSVLIFKTNTMPSDFKYLRKQSVQIIEDSFTGYKIPANAVRVIDGVKGVYVLSGNTVVFKEITVLTEVDGFFIVKEQPTYLEDEYYYNKLGLYDNVIVSGKNLYDGKIISASGGKS